MKRHQRLTSLVAIIGLLMLVSAVWLKSPAVSTGEDLQTLEHHELSFVRSSNPTYLAEVKNRIPETGGSGAACIIGIEAFAPKKSRESLILRSKTSACNSRSLWLLNRSLLI